MPEVIEDEIKHQWRKNAILAGIAITLKLVSLNSAWVEEYYSTNWYPKISMIQRVITNKIPFTLGDILYTVWGIIILVMVFDVLKALLSKTLEKRYFWLSTADNVAKLLWLYLFFNILWGLNYDRQGIGKQMGLQPAKYTQAELDTLATELVARVNAARRQMDTVSAYPPRQVIYDVAADAYNRLAVQHPYFYYENTNVKKSFYGWLGDKLGFLGYYNPFTGEAHINARMPQFLLPYVVCHEIGHQLGYAHEHEASFVGFLAARKAELPLFQYSMYFDLFNYANAELFRVDTARARANYRALDTLVKKDLAELRAYSVRNRNMFEPVFEVFYGSYLKMNNQPEGLKSYNRVLAWVVAYRRKYGQI